MDPLTHTLVGLSLARSGLDRRTAFATTTLVVGSNLPDVDVLSYFWGPDMALAVRRGHTHGVLALAIWPFVLTGAIWLLSRSTTASRPGVALRLRDVWLLSALSIWLHPLLDFLNNYGMRFLMPFSGHWFYGDTLFIVDPFVWGALGMGLWLSSRARQRGAPGQRPPLVALAASAAYVIVMAGSNVAAREIVHEELTRAGIGVERVMASPVPLNPFRRAVVVEDSSGYIVGSLTWRPAPSFTWQRTPVSKRPPDEAMTALASDPAAQRFLGWARFPFFIDERASGRLRVLVGDLRYTFDPAHSWAGVSVPLDGVEPSPP